MAWFPLRLNHDPKALYPDLLVHRFRPLRRNSSISTWWSQAPGGPKCAKAEPSPWETTSIAKGQKQWLDSTRKVCSIGQPRHWGRGDHSGSGLSHTQPQLPQEGAHCGL